MFNNLLPFTELHTMHVATVSFQRNLDRRIPEVLLRTSKCSVHFLGCSSQLCVLQNTRNPASLHKRLLCRGSSFIISSSLTVRARCVVPCALQHHRDFAKAVTAATVFGFLIVTLSLHVPHIPLHGSSRQRTVTVADIGASWAKNHGSDDPLRL